MTDELCREIDRIALNFVSIAIAPNLLDVRFLIWNKQREHLKLTYAIDLEKSLDEIWASFSKKCRYDIRKLQTSAPEIQQTKDVSAFLDIWRKRFPELGMQVPLLSDRYLRELVAACPDDVTRCNVIIEGRLAAAAAHCAIQKERYGAWIGGVNPRRESGVIEYLTWEALSGQNQRASRSWI